MIFPQIFCTAQEQLEIFRSIIKFIFLSIEGTTTAGQLLQKPVHSCGGEGPHCRRSSRSDHWREGGSSAGEHEWRPGGVQVGQVCFLYRELLYCKPRFIQLDLFLAVQDSSISDIVCLSLGRSEPTNNHYSDTKVTLQ